MPVVMYLIGQAIRLRKQLQTAQREAIRESEAADLLLEDNEELHQALKEATKSD